MSQLLSSSLRLPIIHRLIRQHPSLSPRPSTAARRPNSAAVALENMQRVLIATYSSSSSSSSSSTATEPENEAPPITVRLVSINDVYDLKNLPKLATLLRSLGHKPLKDHHHHNSSTIFPINGYQQYKITPKSNDIHHQHHHHQQQQEQQLFDNQHETQDLPIAPSAVTLNGDFLCPSALSSIDNGRGHVAAIRAAGITHVSLGNHEADVPLEVLKERLGELSQRGLVKVLNSNVSGLGRHTCQVDVISSKCGRIKVGLVGLLSDEEDMFRDGTFRGLKISSVRERYEIIYNKMKLMESVHCLVPLTHQTLAADERFAKAILEMEDAPIRNVILGGHEHVKIHRIISSKSDPKKQISIVKTGQDAERAAIIDLHFHPTSHQFQSVDIHFEELDQKYVPCPIVQSIVDKHLSALNRMEKFIVLDTKTMLSEYFLDPVTHRILPLSSEYTRYEQTTVGAFFCTAIKAELTTDVCIINGAPIKGNRLYNDGTMTYDQLKHELPFPLKMIVVKMTRMQLREAIQYSRKHIEEGKPAMVMEDGRIERRGYLQTDFQYWRESNTSYDTNHDNDVISVALPRNLLKGFCKIKPLMELNTELEAKNALPNEDDFMKAIDLIVRYCCKDRWISIAKQFTFSDLDLKRDGTLCREDIRMAIKTVMKEEPSDGLVDEMVRAIDLDSSGFVEEKEFNEILAQVRRHS